MNKKAIFPFSIAQLWQDALEMLEFIKGIPWNAIRIFMTSSALLLFYKMYCSKSSFYRRSIKPIVDLDREFFGLGHRAWMYVATFFLLFVTAFLISRYVDKNKPKELGMGLGDWRFGLRWSAIFLGIMLPMVFAASFTEPFANKYPLSRGAQDTLEAFLVWEALSFLYFVGWEYYFRGYLLFSLYKYIGAIAVLVPMIPFTILHSSKPLPEALGAIFVAEMLCLFALRARSFWYGMIVHWGINTAMDVAAVWQKGGFLE